MGTTNSSKLSVTMGIGDPPWGMFGNSNHYYDTGYRDWWRLDPFKPYDPFGTSDSILTYTTIVHPSQITDKDTGEVTEVISFDVPGLTAKDVKVQWYRDTRTLTLVGINEKLGRTYTFSINTFSEDLLEDTLTTTVENGVATITGKLKKKKKKEEDKVLDIPVK